MYSWTRTFSYSCTSTRLHYKVLRILLSTREVHVQLYVEALGALLPKFSTPKYRTFRYLKLRVHLYLVDPVDTCKLILQMNLQMN